MLALKYWEIIADNLKKAGFSPPRVVDIYWSFGIQGVADIGGAAILSLCSLPFGIPF
jgi:hypothetical protein